MVLLSSVAGALFALGLLRRAPWAPLTVFWQLRVPAAFGGLALAGGALTALDAPREAAAVAAGAAVVLARAAFERRRGARRVQPLGPSASLAVVTLNCGLHRSDPEQIAAFLRDCGADLIGVQEIEREHALVLAQELRATHPHQVLHGTGIDGIGLLSRFPIRGHELVHLAAAHPYLVAAVESPVGPLHVVVVHPPAALAVRGAAHAAVEDLRALAREAAAHAPALILGDFNTTAATAAWDAVAREGFADAFRDAGTGAGVTFPVPFKYLGLPVPPLVRIDFVFTTEDLAATRAEVGPPTSSDHLPLFVTFVPHRVAGERRGHLLRAV